MTMEQERNQTTSELSRETLASWEIASVVVSALLAEWFFFAFLGRNRWALLVPVVMALLLMFSSHRFYNEGFKELGFRFDNFIAACRLLIVPTIVALLGIFLLSWLSGSIDIKPLRLRFLLLPLWALFQQYALQGYINRRAQVVLGQNWRSVLLVAVLFAVLHIPNIPVAIFTLLGGAVWAAVYQRHPNLFALALSHSLASVALALLLPGTAVNNLRVGFKFFG
jgi:membrane protease YdiL (CAAX protease family)